MAKLFALLFALCVVPSIVTAVKPLSLSGFVKCDYCKAGFETSACTHIKGAIVLLQCINRTNTSEITHTQQARTNSLGLYNIDVFDNHTNEICDVKLVESGDPNCNVTSQGREQSRVILTSENGLATNNRFANTLLFESNIPLDSCTEILQNYQEAEDED